MTPLRHPGGGRGGGQTVPLPHFGDAAKSQGVSKTKNRVKTRYCSNQQPGVNK
jgi:hypothetical protein